MPVLDEAASVRSALERLSAHRFHRVIVVDGGSVDGTAEIVEDYFADHERSGLLVRTSAGRAHQMNRGARESDAEVLVFLHCDCTLPRDTRQLIGSAIDGGRVGGAFVIHTLREGRRPFVRRLLWLADLRSRYARLPYGDQALFVRRAVFERVGGFPNQPILEDIALAKRLTQWGTLARVRAPVLVSSRRFEGNPFRTGLLMRAIPLLARLGVSPERLSSLYPPVR